MDHLTPTAGSAVRRAAQNAGIGSDEPLSHWVDTVADVTDTLSKVPDDVGVRIQQQIRPILVTMQAAADALDKAASRPMLNSHQVKYDLLPTMLVAWAGWQFFLIPLVLALGVGAGIGFQMWRTPAFNCQHQNGGTVCYYWKTPATELEPQPAQPATPAQPSATPPAKATMNKGKL